MVKIDALSGLRGIFAIMIVLHHMPYNGGGFFFIGGTLSVTFFFVLSAFSLCLGYWEKIKNNKFVWTEYIEKRFIRIYPLHLLCFTFFVLINSKELCLSSLKYLLTNFLLIQSWIPKIEYYFSGISVTWFLSDLFFLYALFPLVVRVLSSKYKFVVLILWGGYF